MYTVKNEDLSEKAYNAIKKMILKGELNPGIKLYQEKLAVELGISRTPLNGALNQLEKEMLVESLPRRGFIVKKLTLKELLDLYDIRLRLEPLGAKDAASNNDRALTEQCRKLLDSYDKIDAAKSENNFREIDYVFHNLIMEMSGNSFLEKMISSYNIISLGNLQLFKDKNVYPKNPAVSIKEHKDILKYILEKKPEQAEKAMYKHIQETRDLVAKNIGENHS